MKSQYYCDLLPNINTGSQDIQYLVIPQLRKSLASNSYKSTHEFMCIICEVTAIQTLLVIGFNSFEVIFYSAMEQSTCHHFSQTCSFVKTKFKSQLKNSNLLKSLYPKVGVPRFIWFSPTTENEGVAAIKWSYFTSNKKVPAYSFQTDIQSYSDLFIRLYLYHVYLIIKSLFFPPTPISIQCIISWVRASAYCCIVSSSGFQRCIKGEIQNYKPFTGCIQPVKDKFYSA